MEMGTIVEYSAEEQPHSAYPDRIVSPPLPARCCVAKMERVGKIEWEDGFPYYYRRCRVCGYTVRHFLPVNPVDGDLSRHLGLFERDWNFWVHSPRRLRQGRPKSSRLPWVSGEALVRADVHRVQESDMRRLPKDRRVA